MWLMRTNKKIQVILYKEPHDPKFLMLLTNKGEKSFWQGVTGGVESEDSSLEAAAVREVSEELGIWISEKDLIGPLYQYKFKTSHPKQFGQEVEEFCFTAKFPDNAEIILSDEHQKYEWLDYEQAIKTIAHDNPKIFLTKIYETLVIDKPSGHYTPWLEPNI